MNARLQELMAPLAARWQTLAVRERRAVRLAAWVLGLGLVWWLALSPALRTLQRADGERVALETQLLHMQDLQSQALALKSQPKLSTTQAVAALQSAVTQQLGGAPVSVVGQRATVSLKAVRPQALADWLVQVRANAHAMPTEARLTRTPGQPATAITWDGTVVLQLP